MRLAKRAPLVLLMAACCMRAALTGVAAASGEGTWDPQTIDVSISSDQSAVWSGTITYTPSFSVLTSGELGVRFGGRVQERSTTKACLDAAGGSNCLEKWRYPEQHVTSISVTFDRGSATSVPLGLTDGGHADLPIPAGATQIVRMEATVGDVGTDTAHDSRGTSTDVTRKPGTLVFPDVLRLSDGGRVNVAPSAPQSETFKTTASWPWYAAALAAALAALAAAKIRRPAANMPGVDEPFDECLPDDRSESVIDDIRRSRPVRDTHAHRRPRPDVGLSADDERNAAEAATDPNVLIRMAEEHVERMGQIFKVYTGVDPSQFDDFVAYPGRVLNSEAKHAVEALGAARKGLQDVKDRFSQPSPPALPQPEAPAELKPESVIKDLGKTNFPT